MSWAFRATGRLLLVCMALAGCSDPEEPTCVTHAECDGGLCIGDVCVARKGKGEACSRWPLYDDAGILEAGSDCVVGLFCSSLSGRCGPSAPLGARCGDDGDCGAHRSYRSADDPVCVPAGGTAICASPRTVPPGGACLGDRACAGDLRCLKNADGSSTCRGPGVEGEPCERGPARPRDPSDLCAPGLYCAESPPVCRARAGLGETCAGASCLEGLVCRPASKVCEWPAALSEACDGDLDCAAGLTCIFGSCAPPSPRGGPCSNPDHCAQSDRCIFGVCSAPSMAGLPCAFSDDCAAGLYCVMGVCRAGQAGPGDACESSCGGAGPCVENVCLEKSAIGGPCDDFRNCADGLFCQEGACVRQRPIGAPCASTLECVSTICSGWPGSCAETY